MHINGLVSFEPDGYSTPNKFHNHLLIESENKLCKYSIWDIKDILIKSSCNLTDKNSRKTFINSYEKIKFNSDGVSGIKTGCFHVIENYSDGASKYITKKINNELNSVKFLGIDGLSDCGLEFIRRKYGYKNDYKH